MAGAPPVIIRVGCSLDTSVEKTFRDFEKRAQRAGDRAASAMGGRGRRRQQDDGAAIAAKAAERKVTEAVEGESQKRHRIFRDEARARLRETRAGNRQLLSEIGKFEREQARAQRTAQRAVERQAKAHYRELDRFATRTSHRTTRFLMPNAPIGSIARRGLSDVMRGIGIDPSVSGAVSRSTELQRSAVALSTAGYIPGEAGPAGTRVDAGALQAEARTTAEKFSLDPQAVIEAQDQFVKLTGDLATSRQMMGELSGISIASGASLQDMATAAGELGNALGNMGSPEEKMKAISGAIRVLAAQGKVGAVEIKDYARYMAHIGGAVGQFGGDRGQRIAQFGALTQLAKKYGGGTTAAVATRSISGFSETLSKGARREMFKKHGVAIEDEKGMFRDPFAIIRDAIRKTEAKAEPMNEMFANVIGAKAVKGLGNVYKQAGGGEKGMAAIDAELKLMMDANSMTDKAIADAVTKYEETTAAKAAKFQGQLDKIVEASATKLIPALEKLAPQALKLADSLGRLVSWAASNPGQAIVNAILFSIARAGLESAGRAALERAIWTIFSGFKPPVMGAPGSQIPFGGPFGTGFGKTPGGTMKGPGILTAPGAGTAGVGTLAAGAGLALGLNALSGYMAVSEFNALQGNRKGGQNQTGADEGFGSWVNFLTGGVVGAIGSKAGGASWGESLGQLTHAKVAKGAWDIGSWALGGEGAKAPEFMSDLTGDKAANEQARAERARADEQLAKIAAGNEQMANAMRGTLNVNVTNASEIRAGNKPSVDDSGRDLS